MLIYTKIIHSDFDLVDQTVKEVLNKIDNMYLQLSDETRFNINFMLREILNNAVEHGNHLIFEKKVYLNIFYEERILTFVVKDEGEGIDLIHSTVSTDHKKHVKAYHKVKDNAEMELIKALNELSLEHDITTRNRGFETIKLMHFGVDIDFNKVTVTLDLNREANNGTY